MCVLSRDPDDLTFTEFLAAQPGNISLKVVPKSSAGQVAIVDDAGTFVGDKGTGKLLPRTVTGGTTLSFAIAAGQTLSVNLHYECFPESAQGWLEENCDGGIAIFEIDGATSGQTLIVKG